MNSQRAVEVYSTPIMRRVSSGSRPQPVKCAYCSQPAYCMVKYELEQVIKVEYVCKSCKN